MPNELARGGQAAPRSLMARPIEYITVFIGVLLCVLIYLLFGTVKHLEQVQREGVGRGYANRAVTCDLQRGLGLTESKGCNEKVLKPYRDPSVGPGSTAGARESKQTHDLLCFVLEQASKRQDSTLVLPPGACPAP